MFCRYIYFEDGQHIWSEINKYVINIIEQHLTYWCMHIYMENLEKFLKMLFFWNR